MNSPDHPLEPSDARRRKLLATATAVAGGAALAGASVPFLMIFAPSERAKAAGAPVEVELAALKPGELATVEWRGRPVWILRRTHDMLASLESARPQLTDPDSRVTSQQPEYARNHTRSIKPELWVAVSLCTHLGCIPSYYPARGSHGPDWPGGWYCPCHGSKFDLAGRVHRGSPAPTNLVIPPHRYLSDTKLVVGLEEKA